MIKRRRIYVLFSLLALAMALMACEQIGLTDEESPIAEVTVAAVGVDAEAPFDVVVVEAEGDTTTISEPDVDILASALTDNYPIYNVNGDELGTIGDLLINVTTGRVLFVFMQEGGLLGIGETDMVLPFTALTWTGIESLVLQVPEDALQRLIDAPEEWPASAGENWDERLYAFWQEAGVSEIPEADVDDLMRLSELLTVEFDGQQDQSQGLLTDLVIRLDDGHIQYLVLAFDEESPSLVPWQAVLEVGDTLVFDPELDPEWLTTAPRLLPEYPVRWIDPDWDEAIVSFWAEAGFSELR